METKELKNSPTPEVQTTAGNLNTSIPDCAINRLARFFLPLMQASFSEKPSAHLQPKENGNMMYGKEVSV